MDIEVPSDVGSLFVVRDDLPVEVLRPGESFNVPTIGMMGGGPRSLRCEDPRPRPEMTSPSRASSRSVFEGMKMDINVSLEVDPSNFLRRECPNCELEFKWHVGPTDRTPESHVDPDQYFCPYCGEASGVNTWFTKEQLEYARQEAMGAVPSAIEAELKKSFGNPAKFAPNKFSPPVPIQDPDDMTVIEAPCHDFEPIKVQEDLASAFHCLLCGAAFRL